jgi:DNA repair exonuclease SbcCD ATPase subunit
MIILSKLRWSNLFSYGENNEIDFTKNPLTQIVGANGFGKSSIALILEEALYNKNSKGIKKADILNRNVKAKSYSIELEFEKDGNQYEIRTTRGSTQTVKLLENGIDISGHTATSTYSIIQNLLGYDHKTFAQIVYQSSAASLEFLTATDGNRKKFLIELLSLSKYVDIGEVFKDEAKQLSNKLVEINTKITVAENTINKFASTDLEPINILFVPESPRELIEQVSAITDQITTIDTTNKKIAQNNKYKELRDSITISTTLSPSFLDPTIREQMAVAFKTIRDEKTFIDKMSKLGNKCPTCLQDIDTHKVHNLVEESTKVYKETEQVYIRLEKIIEEHTRAEKVWKEESKKIEEYEKYHNLYDPKLQQTLLDKEELTKQVKDLEKQIKDTNDRIKAITDSNSKAIAHNAKIEVIKNQLEEAENQILLLKIELDMLSERNNILQILIKTFSPTGLVAYKIECLIKDLELLTNEYLAELSSGRFQLTFKISADKLNVVITDNGKDIEIYALSSGERARVNAAALLGIRKLMQSISNSKINLLFLDETIDSLDPEGKEKMIEVLLNEESLNTFIVSHSFSHPLLERIYVIKEKNISRIENG